MTRVVLNEQAIRQFFHNGAGPLGRYIRAKSDEVLIHAAANAAPHVRSGDMLAGLQAVGPLQAADSLYEEVGSDARHPWKGHADFNYPLALEFGGVTPQGRAYGPYPWLAPALISSGFRRGA